MLHPIGSPPKSIGCAAATRRHLRGSNLLLFGRMISLAINLLVNVLIVRYLSKDDYGAFSYGLAIGALGANLMLVGMPRAVGRFAPLYHERGDHGSMVGSLILSTAVVAALGASGLALVYAVDESFAARWVADPLALQLTMVLVVLAPMQALDNLFENMLGAFASAGSLFVRRCVLGPLLRLVAVLAVMFCSGGVRALATAYVGASLLGLVACGLLLLRSLARTGVLRHLRLSELRFHPREILGFGLPLVFADVMIAARAPMAIVLLECMRGTQEVADLNAFLKISGLNLIVLQSMRQLFVPVVTRMLARDEHDSIDEIYWQTTTWISLLTFPIFLPCIVMPDTLALLVNGPDYVASSGVLVMLALGDFVTAALGPNTNTLHAYAKVRFVVWTTCAATLCGALVAWLLVAAHGAMGAAAGLSTALVLQNVLHHWGLRRHTSVGAVRPRHLGVYASQAAVILALLAFDAWLDPHAAIGGLVVIGATLGLMRLHRRTMQIADVLPEVGRIPLLGSFLLVGPSRPAARGAAIAHEQAPPS